MSDTGGELVGLAVYETLVGWWVVVNRSASGVMTGPVGKAEAARLVEQAIEELMA